MRDDEDVRRLDVPMDDPMRMWCIEPVCDLNSQIEYFVKV
jgi:hypothetical protein